MVRAVPYLSIVVPVFDEQDSLGELYAQIKTACETAEHSFELIFVDDGSRDQSPARLDALAAADSRVSVIHLRRNFGKSPALAAAFQQVQGEIVLTLDADLQDDPAMIPAFVERIEAGADLVSGYKMKRHDPLEKRLPSKLFNAVVRRLSGVPLRDFNCGFKAYRIECVRELSVYGGLHRFLPVLASERGFRVEELVVQHRPRMHGTSKFGVGRYLEGVLDLMTVMLLTRYRMRPSRFFVVPGALAGVAGVSILSYLSVMWFLGHSIGGRPLFTLGVLLAIMSGLFVSIGLLAELVVRTTIQPQEIYSVRRVAGGPKAHVGTPLEHEARSSAELSRNDATLP
jgi:glycosyltransferase involved in cell wall biosynthesis